ncbi:Fe-S cluster assembly protein SufD [Fulvivirga sedimenti]|uniref:Fe-S cluster assembly protein SufD n=1 Tax=Fulvivirga sedimenti TaxID=2879465 RepID=A0A9X1HNN6_9BACT|nr:Fe-S cluster assembly protein SufD [Fulvivirga sedimenti]MCA6073529.1 Fe-S cluster assembly protein SufD [Fulvivirga sedimenti]
MTEMMEHIKELFAADEAAMNGSASPVLQDVRKKAFTVFEKQGIPGKKHEEYKYTDLSKVYLKFNDIVPGKQSTASAENISIDGISANELVFVNGRFNAEQSKIIDKALEVSDLTEALKNNVVAQKAYGRTGDLEKEPFLALNTAFSRSGVFIHVPGNVRLEHPVILHHFTDASEKQLTYVRHLVVAENCSEATFIEKFDSKGSEEFLLNTVTETFVASNASIHWFKIQNDQAQSYIIDQLQVYQERDSRYAATTITLNGNTIRNNVNIALDGENCETHLYGLYAIDGKTHIDNHTSVDHIKPHSFSNELYKGILDDQAGGVFNGKVFVRQEAQKTNAFQSNKNILLSDEATVNTKPQLEIWADDVKCSHGCTTGQIDQEALFYLRSRGLSEKSARALMLYAFALETIDHVESEPLKKYLESLISHKLNFKFS